MIGGASSARVKIKICGITRTEDAALAARLGAWAIGLVFAPSSPRRIDEETARRLAAAAGAGVLRVGVFVDQTVSEMLRLSENIPLDLIQLHGAEGQDVCRALGPERVIKAVVLRGAADVEAAAAFASGYLLADRPRPEHNDTDTDRAPYDAKGARALAATLAARHPKTLLAGGLDASNAAEALRGSGAWGIDVSSGIEQSPGIKDPAKLSALFAALQGETAR